MEDRARLTLKTEWTSERIRGKSLHLSEVAQCALLRTFISMKRDRIGGSLSHGAQSSNSKYNTAEEREGATRRAGGSVHLNRE